MAGSLMLSEDAVWRPAGWVFDHTLDALAPELRAADTELAQTLLSYRMSVEPGDLDLRRSDRRRLLSLARAVDEVYARFRADGPEAICDRRFYPGLMSQLAELRAMLHSELMGQLWGQAPSPSCSSLS